MLEIYSEALSWCDDKEEELKKKIDELTKEYNRQAEEIKSCLKLIKDVEEMEGQAMRCMCENYIDMVIKRKNDEIEKYVREWNKKLNNDLKRTCTKIDSSHNDLGNRLERINEKMNQIQDFVAKIMLENTELLDKKAMSIVLNNTKQTIVEPEIKKFKKIGLYDEILKNNEEMIMTIRNNIEQIIILAKNIQSCSFKKNCKLTKEINVILSENPLINYKNISAKSIKHLNFGTKNTIPFWI